MQCQRCNQSHHQEGSLFNFLLNGTVFFIMRWKIQNRVLFIMYFIIEWVSTIHDV